MSVDQAIDEFIAAGTAQGISEPSAPADRSALDQLEAEIAPLKLPAGVRRFWERVDTSTLRVVAPISPIDPDFALDSWKMAKHEVPGNAPTALLTFASESHLCLSVELDRVEFEGGAVFDWDVVDGGFTRRFNRFEDWLVFLTDAIASDGLYETRVDRHGRMNLVPTERGYEQFETHIPPSHPFYGEQLYIERDIMEWPTHWRVLDGITEESRRLRGATHTIAELLATDPAAQSTATLVATVVSLADFGRGTNVRVDDGTGLLVINCPRQTTAVGPVLTETFEFDVVVPEGERVAAFDPKTVRGDLSAQMQAEYAQPIGAVAFAIRRI